MQNRKTQAALLSIVSNTMLVIGKLVVGALSGSVAVVSEAVHSATDLGASIIAFLSVRVSDHPPDAEHPYGHGKVESISSLLEALLIFSAALYIIHEGISKLVSLGSALPEVGAATIVMGISAVSNLFLSRHLARVGRETDSQALQADAEHLRTDVLTSAGVFVGLLLTHFTRVAWIDPAIGLTVAAMILHTAFELLRQSLQPLMDARLPLQEEGLIRRVLDSDERVLGYHKLRTRKSGSQRHMDAHVQLDDACTLVQAHDITEELEDQIRELLPAIQINIHIEPYQAEMRHQLEKHGLKPEEVNQKKTQL